MMSDKLYDVLSAIRPISERFKKALDKELTLLQLPKSYYLLEAPRVADHAYFLESGFLVSYSYVKGKREVDNFWQPGDIILPAKSFFERTPSYEFIQLAVPSDVFHVSYAGVQRLFSKFADAQYIARIVLSEYHANCRSHINDIKHLSALERYEKLVGTYLNIEQFVSQEDIASYLSITPQSLSRIKRNKERG
jgi:CRP/FNR family transcriptional regulator, anaerobic regulatory protein